MPPKIIRLSLAFLIITSSTGLSGQEKPVGSHPTASQPAKSPSQYTQQQLQEMAEKLYERTGIASAKVLGGIQKQESAVYLKLSYFRKPERLDPNTYASKEEIAEWQKLLQELKEKEDALEKSYTNVDIDLRTALIEQQISLPAAQQIKKTLLVSFPWDMIRIKTQLMHEFISDHSELLAFYDQNWGTWKAGTEPGMPAFDNPNLASKFQNLKMKINSTGQQIEDKYKEITR